MLVNAAGTDVPGTVEELAVEGWDRTLAVNLRAPFLLSNTVSVYWCHNECMPKILYPQAIKEDPKELEKLEKQHRYTHLFQRVRMLRLLKSGACSDLREAARALGYSWRQC